MANPLPLHNPDCQCEKAARRPSAQKNLNGRKHFVWCMWGWNSEDYMKHLTKEERTLAVETGILPQRFPRNTQVKVGDKRGLVTEVTQGGYYRVWFVGTHDSRDGISSDPIRASLVEYDPKK